MNIIEEISGLFAPSAAPLLLDGQRGLLPARLLRKAWDENPAVRSSARRVDSLTESLWDLSAAAARNPEIYPPIVGLIRASADGVEPALGRIELHCGLRTLEQLAVVPDGIHRLHHFGRGVVRCVSGALSSLDGVAERSRRTGTTIFLPHPDLFADLAAPEIYPPQAATFDADAMVLLVDDGLARVAEYSRAFADEVRRCVHTIALTTDSGHPQRWSFNFRLGYLGGIFVNPFQVNTLGMAESIIHEYYHQRLWEWWAYDPLDGLPGEDVTIESPVTNRRRPVSVMVHALVIYTAALHFHDWASSEATDLTGDERAWIDARRDLLRPRVVPLHQRLAATMNPSGRARQFVDFVLAVYRDEIARA